MKALSATQKRLALALGAVLLVSGVFVAVSQNASKPVPKPVEKLVLFTDPDAGFSVRYPSSWILLNPKGGDPLVRLLVGPPATDDTLSVKVIVLSGNVVINANTSTEDIAALQASFDQLIDQLPGLEQVVERTRVDINDTQGWLYLYKFKDKQAEGIHARYFLFQGNKEYIVTFQAYPSSHYATLAGVFDKIIETFNFKYTPASPSPSASASAAPSPTASASPSN
jgi:hypothetical protein